MWMPTRQTAHQERGQEEGEGVGHLGAAAILSGVDVGVEQREIVARRRQRADRRGEHRDRRARLAGDEGDVAFGIVGLAHDDVRPAAAHRLDQPGEVRGARRHARLRLDEVDEIEAETAREVRPSVVIGDDRHTLERRERRLPRAELRVQARDECDATRLVVGGAFGIDARQRFEDASR